MNRDLVALQDREHDVLVIGGGIAGAWTVWEAASRGLKAALVDLADFGQATSWSSLKTAHGGLRHLQRLDIVGFRESVRERRVLLRVAPEVVRPLRFALAARGAFDRVKFLMGGLANDVLSRDRNAGLPADRHIGPTQLMGRATAAALDPAFAGSAAFVWQDAQITHTERLLIGLLHAAVDASAVVVNHLHVQSGRERAGGFEVGAVDVLENRSLTIRARSIVNASGAHLESVARQFGESCGSPPFIRGVNVVLSRSLVPHCAIGAKDRGRYLFLVPWLGQSILGTVYDDGRGPVDALVRDLMDAGRRAFPWAGLSNDHIRVVHAGHVPEGSGGEPIYRSRLIKHKNASLVSLLTAKYTTARATAEAVVESLGRALSLPLPSSVSAERELLEARPLSGTLAQRREVAYRDEMARTDADAIRGRLSEGALGEAVDFNSSRA